MRPRLIILLITLIATLSGSAQVEINLGEVSSQGYFTSINEARKAPLKVEVLDLSMQKLQNFPEEVFTFQNLKKLILPVNYWSEIPEGLSDLANLTELNLSSNYNLNYLPSDIGDIPNLKILYLDDNMLMDGEVEMVRKMLPDATITSSKHSPN